MKTNTAFRLFVVAILLSFFVSGASAEESKYTLRYRFEKGAVLRWNVLQSLKITTQIKGVIEAAETSSRSTKIWTVLDVDADGTATLEYQVGDVKMQRSQTDQKDEKYDSLVDKKLPTAFQSIDGTVGVPLALLTIGAWGETKKPKRIITAYSSGSEENRITIPLPKDPVAVGESWYVDTPVELPQGDGTVKKIAARQKYTLKDVKTGIAKIDFLSQVLTPVDDPKLKSQLIDLYSKGSFEFDLDAGRLVSQKSTIEESVIGIHGLSSSVQHTSRLTECCCGLKSCEICSKR